MFLPPEDRQFMYNVEMPSQTHAQGAIDDLRRETCSRMCVVMGEKV